VDGYATIRRRVTSTQIAGGEHAFTRRAARRFLEREALDIIQPDIRWTGGLSEVLKICDLASAFHIPVMPHRGGMAWALPVVIARPECSVAEGMVLTPEEASYSVFTGEPTPQGGRVTVSEAPGFGLTLQRERLAAYMSDE
jgi:L-rhamnonate dehydratase